MLYATIPTLPGIPENTTARQKCEFIEQVSKLLEQGVIKCREDYEQVLRRFFIREDCRTC